MTAGTENGTAPSRRRRASRWVPAALGALALVAAGAWYAANRHVYSDLPTPLMGPLPALEALGSVSAAQCAACHVEIAKEWASTAHGRATSDPLYVAETRHLGEPYFCDYCHAPLVEQRPETVSGLWAVWPDITPVRSDNPLHQRGLYAEGVTCVACHQRDGHLVGPHETSAAPHPVHVSSELRSPDACADCHTLDFPKLGSFRRPLMETIAEWQRYRELGGDKSCVDCHMPRTGPRASAQGTAKRAGSSHALRGPFDADFVKSGLEVRRHELHASRSDGARATIEVFNATGHHFPTAEPRRRLDFRLELLDARGAVIDARVVPARRTIDLKVLTEPEPETTLTPRETRIVSLERTAPLPERAHRARLVVRFVLWDFEDPIARAAEMKREQLHHDLFVVSAPIK